MVAVQGRCCAAGDRETVYRSRPASAERWQWPESSSSARWRRSGLRMLRTVLPMILDLIEAALIMWALLKFWVF